MKLGEPYIKWLIFTLVVLVFLSSCKTPRSVIKEPLKEYGHDFLLERLDENELKFRCFSAKFNTAYRVDKKKIKFKGQTRIKKDSVIWISFSPALGIEMVRLMITSDSIFYINRMDKTYFTGDYDFVNQFLETRIDFDILQSFIIGNDFQFYETTNFRASVDSREYRLSTARRQKMKKHFKKQEDEKLVLIQNIWLDPQTFKISRVNIKEYGKEHKRLAARYGNFIELEEQLFPSHIIFDITAEKKISIDINYSKLTLDKPLNFPFSIPTNYKRIE